MRKEYIDKNVYEATQERLDFIFTHFDNVLVSFSGGKDSGVCLNMCYEYAKEHNCLDKLSMYHLDCEAIYEKTIDYVDLCFKEFEGIKRKYWICVPVCFKSAVNMEHSYWVPWEKSKKDIWVRDFPNSPYLVTEDNLEFPLKYGLSDYEFQAEFDTWFAKKYGSTAVIIGIRTTESLNRYRAVAGNHKVNVAYDKPYLVGDGNHALAYPIYDWTTEDVFTSYAKNEWEYNKLYDLFYLAGLSVDEMRVASPFNDSAIQTLNLYKVIEPDTWGKLLGRVNGVSFAGIYGGTTLMGWRSITLPKGHTWKSYLDFLLATLPEETRQQYKKKFDTSIKFWTNKGGVLSGETIEELKKSSAKFTVKGKTNYNTDKSAVTFQEYPDDLPEVTDFQSVPSYKRMCVCILKNDILCKYMGFSLTKEEQLRRKNAMEQYSNLENRC